MKKLLPLMLALLALTASALAELPTTYDFGPFTITVPEDAVVEEYDVSATFVRGQTRVVVQCIDQEPQEDPQAQVRALMTVYHAETVDIADLPLREGLYGALGRIANHFGEGVDQLPALVLTDGKLLVLAGYNLDGDTQAVRALMTELLAGTVWDGSPILLTEDTE